MTYSEKEIKEAVKKRKKSFFLKTLIPLCLILISALAMIIFPDVTLIFFAVALIIASIVYLFKTVRRYEPRVLFSGEVTGENIKEHEFVTTNRRLSFGARVIVEPKRLQTSAFAAKRTRTKPPTSAIVYLRVEGGDVVYLDGLTGAQTDIYEIGDTLYKYAGTRFPVIVGREVESQPCPICGTANRKIETRCTTCGLDITDR